MESKTISFANISQRAISSYLKSFSEFKYVPATDAVGAGERSQRACHAFFGAFYASLFEHPENYGLPAGPDAAIAEDEPNEKDKKQAVKRLLDRPRGMIAAGLDFLMLAGSLGQLEGDSLIVGGIDGILRQSKVSKKFLKGFESVGLSLSCNQDVGILENPNFGGMMPALQAIASHCAAYDSLAMGKFLFDCCDFRALRDYQPQAKDLYRVFRGEDYDRAASLHAYFTSKNYKAEIGIGGRCAWTVKYQGDRSVKATPLFQIEYEERYARPQRMQIKCASTARIADLLPEQPRLLQDDFQRRANPCRGDECRWCLNNKVLGPAVVTYDGEFRTVCWYTNPDIDRFDENTVELIEQYERMHAELSPEK